MILLIDNYDSFAYNLYQMIGVINPEIKVVRNDKININEINDLNPDYIVISPGPGRPEDAGISIELVKNFYKKIPILGVCLGHQSIYKAFGGEVSYSKELMHGKSSIIDIETTDPIFKDLNSNISVGRYHSLAAIKDTLPNDLKIIATSDDDEIMAITHKKYPVYGLQFHPESILTKEGPVILSNFLENK
ncbi:MAG: aminodeoxychorismate/anthranilate synthase component II [Methanobrevibacter sp.]|jgi:anthranilate synthase component 2|nr:aminodeoxychorismate/anthranilate synthase component II [Methanobrevibacter sp.]